MELISPRPLTGAQGLRQELFLRAEELEKLVAIYKHKLCGEEMASLNYGSKLVEQSNRDVLGHQRGQFYDIYMRKREEKLREEWRARGIEKEAEMRAMMEVLASTSSTVMNKGKATESKRDHYSQTNSRKLPSSSSIPPPSSRSSAATTQNPTISASKSASLRKENPKSSTRITNENIQQRSIARSQSSNDRMSLVKDIKARRSQSLRKNSLSLGEPKDFMHLNHTNRPSSGAPKPLLKKSNGVAPTDGLSKAKLRISMASQAPLSEENQLNESTELLKEENEQVDSTSTEDVRKLRSKTESWNSAYHRFESGSQIVESPELSTSQNQNFPFDVHDAADFDSSLDCLCFAPATVDSHNMNQYLEDKNVRVRKKWGSVERPYVVVDDASTHPIIDVTKGIRRFLKFGKTSGGIEMHNDKKYDHDSENYSLENSNNSRIGQIPSFGSFNENGAHCEQVNRPHNPSHSTSLKEKEKHHKQRVLSSLPSFHVREKENKKR